MIKWTNVKSYQQKLAFVDRLEAQVLYGSAVTVLENDSSLNTASTARIDHIDRSGYGKEYAGARRYTN